jgi:hypothetical protein
MHHPAKSILDYACIYGVFRFTASLCKVAKEARTVPKSGASANFATFAFITKVIHVLTEYQSLGHFSSLELK